MIYRLIAPKLVENETFPIRIISGPINEEDLPEMPFIGAVCHRYSGQGHPGLD